MIKQVDLKFDLTPFMVSSKDMPLKAYQGAVYGLRAAGEHLRGKAEHYVPVMSGDLRKSGKVEHIGTSLCPAVKVNFGAGLEYAALVHEDITRVHGKAFNIWHKKRIQAASTVKQKKMWFYRREQEQAKYLERPLREEKVKLMLIVSEAMKRFMFRKL